jgi:hypothetical protein
MVTFRREIRLWHETGVTQRALMIRDDADSCWLACQMQHSRIMTPGLAVINDPRSPRSSAASTSTCSSSA